MKIDNEINYSIFNPTVINVKTVTTTHTLPKIQIIPNNSNFRIFPTKSEILQAFPILWPFYITFLTIDTSINICSKIIRTTKEAVLLPFKVTANAVGTVAEGTYNATKSVLSSPFLPLKYGFDLLKSAANTVLYPFNPYAYEPVALPNSNEANKKKNSFASKNEQDFDEKNINYYDAPLKNKRTAGSVLSLILLILFFPIAWPVLFSKNVRNYLSNNDSSKNHENYKRYRTVKEIKIRENFQGFVQSSSKEFSR